MIFPRAYICAILVWTAGIAAAEDVAHDAIPSPLMELADRVGGDLDPDVLKQDGHYACVVEYPYDALLLRVHLIRAARHTIDIQTYIWANDECSRLIEYELIQAGKRGVQVRVLVDSVGTLDDKDTIAFDKTTYTGIEIKIYRPAARRLNPNVLLRILHALMPTAGAQQRMHNKLMVVDGRIGLTGGRNIGREYFGMSTGYNFKDREVLFAGSQVSAMTKSFEAYWGFKKSFHNHELKDVAPLVEQGLTRPEVTREMAGLDTIHKSIDHDANDDETIRRMFVEHMMPVRNLLFVADIPDKKTRFPYINLRTRSVATHAFMDALDDAEEEVLLQSPYTIFNLRVRHLFHEQMEGKPKPRVRISTNSLGAADQTVTYAANYRLRSKVVRGMDFEMYEMKPHPAIEADHLPRLDELKEEAAQKEEAEPYLSIHAKTYVFDARVVYIGTLNLDPRSFFVNGECGVFIEDEDFARVVRETLLGDMRAENSWVIARNKPPLGFINWLIETISALLPVDPWPVRSTSAYELKPGAEEVTPHDPQFYENYENIGGLPGSDGDGQRKVATGFFKTFAKLATPLL